MNQFNINIVFFGLILLASFANGASIQEQRQGRALTFTIEDEWNLIPDENEILRTVHKNKIIDYEPEPYFNAVNDIGFHIFTRKNALTAQWIRLNDVASIRNSNFNASHPTRIIIHGWNNHKHSEVNVAIRMAYLEGNDINVIIVDWGRGANTINYISARNRVSQVGAVVAQFIDFMVTSGGLEHSRLALVGHSLGAHASGIAGKNVKSGKIRAIIGLDPAGPLFYMRSPNDRINKGDADHVEIIHTNAGKLGFADPIGDVDFYPNGGRSQVGCGIDIIGTCSHSRATTYFPESINSPIGFWAIPCQYSEVSSGRCTSQGEKIIMGGEPLRKEGSGVYFLRTATQFPFALGR